MLANFSIQDILGSLLAFIFFPLVFIFPGYVCAWVLDLFDFKQRLLPTRLAIAVVISLAISPVLLFLAYRLGSADWALLLLLGLFGVGCACLVWMERKIVFKVGDDVGKLPSLAAWIFGGWALLAITSLVDLQWGKRLYFSMVAFDFTSRVSIIAAITRTGVPPVNPGYFAGESVRLTFLYYFWYIPCSLIDKLGGAWVDARMALIASVAWSGIGLICLVALYLRLRNPFSGAKAWKTVLMGIGALMISGLDIYPALIFMLGTRLAFGYMWPVGDMEHWNERITAWTSALLWAPHHVAGLVVCLVGFLLIQYTRGKSLRSQLGAAAIAGLAFASATGLSIWMTATFVLFWVVWMLFLFFQKEHRTVLMMLLAGICALGTISPFLVDLFRGSSSVAAGSFPVVFQVRSFTPLLFFLPFLGTTSAVVVNLVNLIFLPLNYFLELGFYLLIGWLWLRRNARSAGRAHAYHLPEILLLGTAVLVGTFLRSTLIAFNDLGWRSWLFGQFIFLIWALDIGREFLANTSLATYLSSKPNPSLLKPGQLLAQLLLIGIITTVFSLMTLRTWAPLTDLGVTGVPSFMSPDLHLGERTFAAREAYEYIRDSLPEHVIVQFNPTVPLDRPSGLYGTRQMVAADYSAYGMPLPVFQSLQLEVSPIFQDIENGWSEIDRNCKQHYIDVIILNDQDPVWRNLSVLKPQRQPLYANDYYAVFACGDFARR